MQWLRVIATENTSRRSASNRVSVTEARSNHQTPSANDEGPLVALE
jgi:hypothetical protein